MKINCKKYGKEAKKIKVEKLENEDVIVQNDSSLEMIGKGRQGAVFKIDETACMKVYGEQADCEREYYALSLGKDTPLLPAVYCKGSNYIVMEMVYGVDLREYLQTHPLTEELSYQLIQMLITFKQIGYERIDHHKRQIYLQEDGSLRVIDVGRTVWRNRTYPYPRKLLDSLGTEYKAVFLEQVKKMAPELYGEWQHYIQMEEVSRQVYQRLQETKKIDIEALNSETRTLLTTTDPEVHYEKLLGLVRKVVKEERALEKEKLQKDEREREQKRLQKEKREADRIEKMQMKMEKDQVKNEEVNQQKESGREKQTNRPQKASQRERVKIIIEEKSREKAVYLPFDYKKSW